VTRRTGPPRLAAVDAAELAAFRGALRRRYSDEQILDELRAAAERAGRSPTIREFASDPKTTVHPQTVVERFGSWNAAKRRAGLRPRRFATREELLDALRRLGEELERAPTARELERRRGSLPSRSLYAHVFGSLANALREAGFDVGGREARLEAALTQGATLARKLGRLPSFADWAQDRRRDPALLTEWQVYRLVDAGRGAWSAVQYLIRERLREEGASVAADGRLEEK
jgi:HNH endonuclease